MQPVRPPSLDDALDELFYSTDKLPPEAIIRVCEAFPDHRADIMELVALWVAYEAMPDVADSSFEESSSHVQRSPLEDAS